MRGTSQLFVAGPPVVAAAMGEAPDKEALGGARAQTRAGAVDNEAADEEDAFAQIRRFLSYLPASVWEPPPVLPAGDPVDRREDELSELIPRDRRTPYDARRLLALVCDRGSVFELGARYGRPLITALARLDGRPVGVLCSDPKHYAGGLTGDASDKLARFVDLCDQFHLPVASFVDQPGFVIGTEAERAGTIRRGARALFALYQSTVPRAAVLVRKVYGVAGAGMGTAPFRWAWPSGDWGSLPIEGGLEAAYRRELDAAEDRAALRAEIQARLDAVRSPSAPPSASASRRSSTRATHARCCATGRRGQVRSRRSSSAARPAGRGPSLATRAITRGTRNMVSQKYSAVCAPNRKATGIDSPNTISTENARTRWGMPEVSSWTRLLRSA